VRQAWGSATLVLALLGGVALSAAAPGASDEAVRRFAYVPGWSVLDVRSRSSDRTEFWFDHSDSRLRLYEVMQERGDRLRVRPADRAAAAWSCGTGPAIDPALGIDLWVDRSELHPVVVRAVERPDVAAIPVGTPVTDGDGLPAAHVGAIFQFDSKLGAASGPCSPPEARPRPEDADPVEFILPAGTPLRWVSGARAGHAREAIPLSELDLYDYPARSCFPIEPEDAELSLNAPLVCVPTRRLQPVPQE